MKPTAAAKQTGMIPSAPAWSRPALVEKLSAESLPPELPSAKQFVAGMFQLAYEERKLKDRLIHEILKLKR